MTGADLRYHVASKALGALTHERYGRLCRRGEVSRDQMSDLIVMENLEHDILLGEDRQHRRYGLTVGLTVGGAS